MGINAPQARAHPPRPNGVRSPSPQPLRLHASQQSGYLEVPSFCVIDINIAERTPTAGDGRWRFARPIPSDFGTLTSRITKRISGHVGQAEGIEDAAKDFRLAALEYNEVGGLAKKGGSTMTRARLISAVCSTITVITV